MSFALFLEKSFKMAASMSSKGISRLRILSAVHRECDMMYSLQKPQCRYANKLAFQQRLSRKSARKQNKNQKPEMIKEFLVKVPPYSVYEIDKYPPQKFMLDECINMHKEAAQPAMRNNLHAQLYADMKLSMTTKKQTKFMSNFRGLLTYPHQFDHGQQKKIMVFSESDDDLKMAEEMGATFVGGESLIQQINQGKLHKDDIAETDFVMCTPALSTKITLIRPLLRDKTPTIKNACVSANLQQMFLKYMDGVKYVSHKDSDSEGRIQIPIGQLHQDISELEENFQFMVETLSALKANTLAPLIQSITFVAPPSEERFELKVENYVEGHEIVPEVEEELPHDSDDEVEQKTSSSSR